MSHRPDPQLRRVAIALAVLIVLSLAVMVFLTGALLTLDLTASYDAMVTSAPEGPRRDSLEAWRPLVAVISANWGLLSGIVACLSLVVAAFLGLVVLKAWHADQVQFWGLKIVYSDALRLEQEQTTKLSRTVMALEENIREVGALHKHLNHFLRTEEDLGSGFHELLDKATQTAGFTVRPVGRSVRVSLWLCDSDAQQMRIVSGHRISPNTLRTFRLDQDEHAFAAELWRTGRYEA